MTVIAKIKATSGRPDWVGAMLGNPRFDFTARLCTDIDRLRLIATHLPTDTSVELEVCGHGNADMDVSRVELCEKLVAEMLETGIVDYGLSQFARLLRCEYANRLIEVISSYGRCYFYSRKRDSVARLSFDQRVYLHDENGATIEAKATSKWDGFSHNDTMRDLVLQMRNYVMRGERIDPAYIGIDSPRGQGILLGYSPDQMQMCWEAAKQLPIINVASPMECAA